MKATTAWDETASEFALTNDQVIEKIQWFSSFGRPYALFMEHEVTAKQRDWLIREGYKIRRSQKEENKIEISWEGRSE